MSNFTPINTQEEFDTAIAARLKRERETVSKQYEGYLSPDDAKKQYEGYLSPDQVTEKYKGYLSPAEVAEKDAKLKSYETTSVKMRIAHENNIPFELVSKLSGETEEEIQADAKNFAKFLSTVDQPLASGNGGSQESATDAAYKEMAQKMK